MIELTDTIKKELTKTMQDMIVRIGTGGINNYEEYKHLTGVVKGLTISINTIDDIVKKYLGDDDNE